MLGSNLCRVMALAAILSGCSSTYHMRATVIQGSVVFVADSDFFGNPDCIGSIEVRTDDGPPATAIPGDDVGAVRVGVYWEETFASPSCENPFPVKYGAKLSGPPFVYSDGEAKSVAAKPLMKGVTYTVEARSSGSAYGGGKFEITKDGKVINLSG